MDYLDRLDTAGLTLAQASALDDVTLLRKPYLGRKTLRFIRSYQGPWMPLPVLYIPPPPKGKPLVEDYRDADGYVDYEAYDDAWDDWCDRCDFEHSLIPDLRETWCTERQAPVNHPVEDDWLKALIAQ